MSSRSDFAQTLLRSNSISIPTPSDPMSTESSTPDRRRSSTWSATPSTRGRRLSSSLPSTPSAADSRPPNKVPTNTPEQSTNQGPDRIIQSHQIVTIHIRDVVTFYIGAGFVFHVDERRHVDQSSTFTDTTVQDREYLHATTRMRGRSGHGNRTLHIADAQSIVFQEVKTIWVRYDTLTVDMFDWPRLTFPGETMRQAHITEDGIIRPLDVSFSEFVPLHNFRYWQP